MAIQNDNIIINRKLIFVIAVGFTITVAGSKAFAQPPQGPPPPPPSPKEVFNKINPFKKKVKKDTAIKATVVAPTPAATLTPANSPGNPPPPPPNPLDLFRKKKKKRYCAF